MDSNNYITTFNINHNHNYYACPVSRPGSQLLLLRLEWEAFNDSDSDSDSDSNSDNDISNGQDSEDSENKEDDFTLSIINFAGTQYVVTSLERSVHNKVISIAESLNLKVLPGYPLAKSISSSNTVKTYHFPINCAADSIYTIEGFIDVNDESELLRLKIKESQQIRAYLAEKSITPDTIDNDIELINDSNYEYKQKK